MGHKCKGKELKVLIIADEASEKELPSAEGETRECKVEEVEDSSRDQLIWSTPSPK